MISTRSIFDMRLCCPLVLILGVLFLGTNQVQASSVDYLGPRSKESLDYQLRDLSYDDDDDDDSEGRFLFSSTTGVTVNSTLIRVVGAIIGALLIGLPLFLAYTTALNSNNNGGGGYGGHYRRFKREEQDELASLIYAIMESFRKYEVNEIGCQIELACESSQFQKGQKHSKYGGLLAKIHKLLSMMTLFELDPQEFVLHDYVLDLLKAHESGLHSGNAICSKNYGSKCSRSS